MYIRGPDHLAENEPRCKENKRKVEEAEKNARKMQMLPNAENHDVLLCQAPQKYRGCPIVSPKNSEKFVSKNENETNAAPGP
jgi:hypothetical protein